MRILVLDDDLFFSQWISELLADEGVEVQLAGSAQEALSLDFSFLDGAIVDLMIPNDPAASGISVEESRGGFFTGVAVARRILVKKPALRLVLISSMASSDAETWVSQRGHSFVPKGQGYHALLRALRASHLIAGDRAPLSFIVHGHDSEAVLELKNYVQNVLHWQEPIVLREQKSGGRTLIEKFEDYSRRVDYIFVLLTPDDKVPAADATNDERRRSRQNVIFEAGFFYGALERKSGRVLLLHKGPIELPSDLSGIVWIDISNGIAAAGEEIRREIAKTGSGTSR